MLYIQFTPSSIICSNLSMLETRFQHYVLCSIANVCKYPLPFVKVFFHYKTNATIYVSTN